MELLKKLDSTSWSERYEGLDHFYDLVSLNPSGVSSCAIKVIYFTASVAYVYLKYLEQNMGQSIQEWIK